jgi:tRNA-2-methylthio-N6-dimethylallyladenosine synthase
LHELLSAQHLAVNAREIGRALAVLVEKQSRIAGQMFGRSPYLQAVRIDGAAGSAAIGEIVAVEILAAEPGALSGRLLQREAAAE